MKQPEKIQGIFTPNIIPLDESGQINEPELRRYTDWLVKQGVHGLYPNGSTSEFPRFTSEERRRVVEIMFDEVAGRVPIIAGVSEANVRDTVATCEAMHSLGVRAVSIVAPYYFKLSPDAVYHFYKEVGDHTPIDVVLYHIPMFASSIDLSTIRRLSAECPRIVGVKDSTGDVSNMLRMVRDIHSMRPEFALLSGWEAVLMPMLVVGCNGGVHASSGVVPEITRSIYELTLAGQLDKAKAQQFRLIRIFDLMLRAPEFPDGFRAALELRGFRMGLGRQPISGPQRLQTDALRKELEKMLSEDGINSALVGP